jgi:hypothetical protein
MCDASFMNLYIRYKQVSVSVPSPERPVRKKARLMITLEEQIEANTGIPTASELRQRREDELTKYLDEDPVPLDHPYAGDPFAY